MLLVKLLGSVLVLRLADAGKWCSREYWSGQCTACPGYWYQTCSSGYGDAGQKGCGFLSAGCETKCRNDRWKYDDGCGCGNGKGCLNCLVGNWGGWSGCSKSCGTGSQSRTRSITRNQKSGGNACPSLRETRNCNTHCCKVNCAVSAWTAWGACSKQCGGGTQQRTRRVTTNASCGGNACPAVKETRNCNTGCCPGQCQVSNWSGWGSCSKTCGGGTQSRKRTITRQPSCGAPACPGLSETRNCNAGCCPVNCEVGQWGQWGKCSQQCGGGKQTRTRAVTTQASCNGVACPPVSQTQDCNTQCCPVQCLVTQWTAFGACSKKCGGGKKKRTRKITRQASCGAQACPATEEEVDCETQPCPIDCKVSDWGEYGQCNEPCGAGKKTRTRTITQDAKHGGKACPALTEQADCKVKDCAVDCDMGDWSEYGDCDATCGDNGVQKRTRKVLKEAQGDGECGNTEESRACNRKACPVDCVVSDWGDWGDCSELCGGGTQSRKRTVTQDDANGGKACPELTENRTCDNDPCPVDCELSDWGEFGECLKDGEKVTCGGGVQTRERTITKAAAYGGKICGELTEKTPCNTQLCKVDCVVSNFGEWGKCSEECGGGEQERTRTINVENKNGGKACPELTEKRACNEEECSTPAPTGGADSPAPTIGPDSNDCTTYDWYGVNCLGAFAKKECGRRGCKWKKNKCTPIPMGKNGAKINCKKIKTKQKTPSKDMSLCSCFTDADGNGCKPKKKGKKIKKCSGSFTFTKKKED